MIRRALTLLLIYADWLEERGDIRGEYLRLLYSHPPLPGRLKILRDQIDPVWLALWIRGLLRVRRGFNLNLEYPLYEGFNYLGKNHPLLDIDLGPQEPPELYRGPHPERISCSPQHALIVCKKGGLFIEDLNSLYGTFVSRARVYPGQRRRLQAGDIISTGNVLLKVIVKQLVAA